MNTVVWISSMFVLGLIAVTFCNVTNSQHGYRHHTINDVSLGETDCPDHELGAFGPGHPCATASCQSGVIEVQRMDERAVRLECVP